MTDMFRLPWLLGATLSMVLGLCVSAEDGPRFAGPTEKGFLLPNGWTISPAGKQIPLTDLPLNIIPLSDSRRVLVATSGYNKHELSLVDIVRDKAADQQSVVQGWFGLVVTPEEDKVWWSGGGGGRLHAFELKDRRLVRTSPAEPEPAQRSSVEKDKLPKPRSFKSGMVLDPERGVLYSLDITAGTISVIDAMDGTLRKTVPAGGRPYDVVLTRNRSRLYVSDWSGRTVLALDSSDLRIVAKIGVGEHPNQIAVHPKDDRLFVACASSNCVSVIDTQRGVVTETIVTALFPRAPEGSTPDAVAVSPDGKTLYVANADNNCIAVVDIAVPNQSQVVGLIPTGW